MRNSSFWVRLWPRLQQRAPSTGATWVHFAARLPSDLEGAFFTSRFDLRWAPGTSSFTSAEESEILAGLVSTARDAAARHSVLAPDDAERAVRVALGRHGGPIAEVQAALEAEAEGIELARAGEESARRTVIAEAERREELRRLTHLRDHVLTSPALARLWWLDGKPERLPDLVRQGEAIDAAVAIIGRGADADSASTGPDISPIVQTFLADLTPEDKSALITQLGRVLTHYEREDLAIRLNSRPHPADVRP